MAKKEEINGRKWSNHTWALRQAETTSVSVGSHRGRDSNACGPAAHLVHEEVTTASTTLDGTEVFHHVLAQVAIARDTDGPRYLQMGRHKVQ